MKLKQMALLSSVLKQKMSRKIQLSIFVFLIYLKWIQKLEKALK
jgi:hypothetical protein